MPHSVLLHKRLVDAGYEVNFWYYKNLTTLYPWASLKSEVQYNVFKKNIQTIKKIFQQAIRADFIIITGWHTYMHLLLMFLAKCTGKKYALWIDISMAQKTYFKTVRNRWLLKMSPYLFITGRVGFKLIQTEYGITANKMRDFPYLTAEFDEHTIKEINNRRRNLISSGNPIKLLISNRFIDRKGYNIILEVFQMFSSSINQYEITILGTGPQFEFYEKQIKKINSNIRLSGWVEYQQYLEYLMECDIFLHASLDEPFGIPPMDAMACGKLVIGSSGVISCIDRISNGIDGFIYDKNNPKQLKEILEFAANSRSEIYKMGDKAYSTAKSYTSHYNIDCINQILKE